MTTADAQIADDYIRFVNEKNPAAFNALFADDVVIDDAGRPIAGRQAVAEWSQHDIFDSNVSLEVLESAERDGRRVVVTQVDGDFDRTGLPNPLVMEHAISVKNDKIVAIAIRLASAPAPR